MTLNISSLTRASQIAVWRGILFLTLSIPSPTHVIQPAFLSRRQSREAHFAHSCENICSGDQLLLLCLCHLSHCALTLAELVGEKAREVRAGKLPSANCPGWQAKELRTAVWRSDLECVSRRHVAKFHPFSKPPLPALHSFPPLSQLHSPFCCQSLWSTAIGSAWQVKACRG